MIANMMLAAAMMTMPIAPKHNISLELSQLYKAHEKVEIVGWLSGYDEEPSYHTMMYRYTTGDIQIGSAEVYIATADCSLVGKTGNMYMLDSEEVYTVQVFDCSGAWDGGVDENGQSVLTKGGYAAEVDYASRLAYPLVGEKVKISLRK